MKSKAGMRFAEMAAAKAKKTGSKEPAMDAAVGIKKYVKGKK